MTRDELNNCTLSVFLLAYLIVILNFGFVLSTIAMIAVFFAGFFLAVAYEKVSSQNLEAGLPYLENMVLIILFLYIKTDFAPLLLFFGILQGYASRMFIGASP